MARLIMFAIVLVVSQCIRSPQRTAQLKFSGQSMSRALTLIIHRNAFYRRNYRLMVAVNVFLLCLGLGLLGFIFYQRKTQVTPSYFPGTPDGQVIVSPPLLTNHLKLQNQKIDADGTIHGMPLAKTLQELKPLGEQALVKHWAGLAVNAMFDLDYVHYRANIQLARQYFTAKGHERFIEALAVSKNLDTMKFRRAVVHPEIDGEVKISGEGEKFQRHAWRILVPFKLYYEDTVNAKPLVQALEANMLVVRVPTLVSPFYGLAITQVNFTTRITKKVG